MARDGIESSGPYSPDAYRTNLSKLMTTGSKNRVQSEVSVHEAKKPITQADEIVCALPMLTSGEGEVGAGAAVATDQPLRSTKTD